MKMKFLTMLLVSFFCLVGISSVAVARDDCGGCSLEGNAIGLENGVKYTEEALEHAKQGHAKETNDATKAARQSLKDIVSTRGGRLLQKPRTNLKKSRIAIKKGDMEEAVKNIEAALQQLKEIDPSMLEGEGT